MADFETADISALEIVGGRPLHGEITVQGSKNAALPILAASLLGDGPCLIENCPRIRDVEDTLAILRFLGCKAERSGSTVSVDASRAGGISICSREASRIRSSVLFLGALLGRMGRVVIPYPGGCAIGRRPIDLHLDALRVLGARFFEMASLPHMDSEAGESDAESSDMIYAEAARLSGGIIHLSLPSVGATENSILAAVCAKGETRIENAALEPEVDELCRFLRLRGADIVRKADGSIHIHGTRLLSPVRYRLGTDRIVSGTYLLAVAACGGSVRFHNLPFEQLDALIAVFRSMGGRIYPDGTAHLDARLQAIPYLETGPYPGFPTDLQSPLMAALCMAQGVSRIRETVFENRLNTAIWLRRMGAHIQTDGDTARIEGPVQLAGTAVKAPDLRGGAALVNAALAASGCTVIDGYEYIARGYEDICRDFERLGADIRSR